MALVSLIDCYLKIICKFENMNIEQIEKVKEKIDITKTDKHLGMSFVIGCDFFSIDKYPNVYLTDYDINNDVSLLDTKNLLCLFYYQKRQRVIQYISIDFIDNSPKEEIENFIKETILNKIQ